MWKDFRNFALVCLTVFAVLGFSVYARNKMDRNAIYYDNLVATKEKMVQDEISEMKQKKELENLEAEKQRQSNLLKQKEKDVYIPPKPVVVPSPTPVPKPSRQTRAS